MESIASVGNEEQSDWNIMRSAARSILPEPHRCVMGFNLHYGKYHDIFQEGAAWIYFNKS